MTWRTHVMAGISSVWLLEILPSVSAVSVGPLVVFAALGSLLPDLDAEEAKIKHIGFGGVKPFVPVASFANRTLGHRGLLHSLIGLGAVALVSLPLALKAGWQTWIALLLGYASHLAADACTPSGIPLLYPMTRRYHLLPRGWRILTGSQAEHVLFMLLTAAVFLLLLSVIASLIQNGAWA